MRIPEIPDNQKTPLISELVEICHLQNEQIQALKDEIARLKGQKTKPNITPSTLEKPSQNKDNGKDTCKRPALIRKIKLLGL